MILHLEELSASLTMASMWFLEKLLISRLISRVQKRAAPPLLPRLGTMRPLANPTLFFIFSIRLTFDLVSMRKTISGFQRCTIICSALTDRGFPSPQQFQLRGIIAPLAQHFNTTNHSTAKQFADQTPTKRKAQNPDKAEQHPKPETLQMPTQLPLQTIN